MDYRIIFHAEHKFIIVKLEGVLKAGDFGLIIKDLVKRNYWEVNRPVLWDVRLAEFPLDLLNQTTIIKAILKKFTTEFGDGRQAFFITPKIEVAEQNRWIKVFDNESECFEDYEQADEWLQRRKEMMPEQLQELMDKYLKVLNERDFDTFESIITDDIIMARGSTYIGKEEVLSWLKEMFAKEDFQDIFFHVSDATAGLFTEDEGQILIYTEIHQDNEFREIFVESLQIVLVDKEWKIKRIFGLSYEEELIEVIEDTDEEEEVKEENKESCGCGCGCH